MPPLKKPLTTRQYFLQFPCRSRQHPTLTRPLMLPFSYAVAVPSRSRACPLPSPSCKRGSGRSAETGEAWVHSQFSQQQPRTQVTSFSGAQFPLKRQVLEPALPLTLSLKLGLGAQESPRSNQGRDEGCSGARWVWVLRAALPARARRTEQGPRRLPLPYPSEGCPRWGSQVARPPSGTGSPRIHPGWTPWCLASGRPRGRDRAAPQGCRTPR